MKSGRNGEKKSGAIPRDIILFFSYALASNIAFGAFSLLYNLYLIQLGYQEDWIGVVNAVSTASLAVSAVVLGRLLRRYGSWACLTYGTALYLLTSLAVTFAETRFSILATVTLQGIATTFSVRPPDAVRARPCSTPPTRYGCSRRPVSHVGLGDTRKPGGRLDSLHPPSPFRSGHAEYSRLPHCTSRQYSALRTCPPPDVRNATSKDSSTPIDGPVRERTS